MSLHIIRPDDVEEFVRTIERPAPRDQQMVVHEEDEDWFSKAAPAADEEEHEDEYVEEDRYSYLEKRMSEDNDVLGLIMYKAKLEDEWKLVVV